MSGWVIRVRQVLHEGTVTGADRPRAASKAGTDRVRVAKGRGGRAPQTLRTIRPAVGDDKLSANVSRYVKDWAGTYLLPSVGLIDNCAKLLGKSGCPGPRSASAS